MTELLLGAAFVLGHAAFWVVILNYVYALPWPKILHKLWRMTTALIILAGPITIWGIDGPILSETLQRFFSDGNGAMMAGYVLVCLVMGGVGLPVVTVRRWMRPVPSGMISSTSTILDVAAELGRKPAGSGLRARMAVLPFNDVFRVELTTLELAPPDLPTALDGLTILHISDVHFYGTPEIEFYECVFDHVRQFGTPDLLLLTGDYVDSDDHHAWLKPLLGRLDWREAAFAVLGNHDRLHDPENIRRALREAGVRVLGNGVESTEIRGEPVVFIGNEELWFRPAPDRIQLDACPDGFRICLSHTPDNLAWASRNKIGLMLSGHVHGGQIRIPGFGSIFVPSRYSRRYDQGTFQKGATVLHVNRGLAGKAPLRFFCKPQVTWITLRKRT